MKYRIVLFIIFFTVTIAIVVRAQTPLQSNEHVKFSISLKEKSLRPGATGNLLVRLQPKRGIHINLKPPISIAIDSSAIIARAGTPDIPKADTFLNSSKPIKQPFTLTKNAKRGAAVLKGTITYFYCSDADGWCSRFKQPFEVMVKVAK